MTSVCQASIPTSSAQEGCVFCRSFLCYQLLTTHKRRRCLSHLASFERDATCGFFVAVPPTGAVRDCCHQRYPLLIEVESNSDLVHMDGATAKTLAEQLSESMFDVADSCQLKLERTAESLKLTFSEFKLIRAMRDNRMLRAGELAQRMQLSSSRLTRILDGLVKKGLARREVGPRDRRVIEVTLTPEGEKVQADLREAWLQAHEDVVELLPAEERESVVLGMTKLSQAAKEWSKR